MILQRRRMPTPSECRPCGFWIDDLVDAFLVEQAAELEVDRPRRQVAASNVATPFSRRGRRVGSASPRASYVIALAYRAIDRRARRGGRAVGVTPNDEEGPWGPFPPRYRCHTSTSRS